MDGDYWQMWRQRVTRRRLLRSAAIGSFGLAVAATFGCGEERTPVGQAPTTATTGPAAQTTATATGAATAGDGPGRVDGRWLYELQDKELLDLRVWEWEPERLWTVFNANRPDPPGQPKKGGTFTIGTTWDIAHLDATRTASGGTLTQLNLVNNRVLKFKSGVGYDPYKIELVPDLAESWDTSPDGLIVTFHLRKGVKFHNIPPVNGRELTSEDVKNAFDIYKTVGVHQAMFEDVEQIETPDPYTVLIKFKNISHDFLINVGYRYLTIFPKELNTQESREDVAIGTGPFMITDRKKAERVSMVKNPDYFLGEPLLDGIEWLILPDHATRLAAHRTEQTDFSYAPVFDQRGYEDLLKTNPRLLINAWSARPFESTFVLAMNMTQPPFDDVRVRRAVAHSIDHQAVIDIVANGWAAVPIPMPTQFLGIDAWTWEMLGPYYQHNTEKAKQLLKEAGYEGGFPVKMIMYEYSAALRNAAELYADQLRQVGINMEVQSLDYTTYNNQWVQRKYPEMAYGWITLGLEANTWAYAHVHSQSPGNRFYINDPEMDKLAEAQRLERDPEKRREILWQIVKRELDQVYRVFTPEGFGIELGAQPWVRGLRFGSYHISSYYDWGQQMERVWKDKT